jgi:hypothetical protein
VYPSGGLDDGQVVVVAVVRRFGLVEKIQLIEICDDNFSREHLPTER